MGLLDVDCFNQFNHHFPILTLFFLWFSHEFSMILHDFSHNFPRFSQVFPWFSHDFPDFPMVFPWFSHDFPRFPHGFPMVFPCFGPHLTAGGLARAPLARRPRLPRLQRSSRGAGRCARRLKGAPQRSLREGLGLNTME